MVLQCFQSKFRINTIANKTLKTLALLTSLIFCPVTHPFAQPWMIPNGPFKNIPGLYIYIYILFLLPGVAFQPRMCNFLLLFQILLTKCPFALAIFPIEFLFSCIVSFGLHLSIFSKMAFTTLLFFPFYLTY